MKILIIEDDVELSAAMADYLELQGMECDFAYNGKSGVLLAEQNEFDVIILDLNLPKLDGFGVCESLRQFGILTPILMLTSNDTEQDQLTGFQKGIDDYVIKPCPMPIVLARLQALFKRKQPQSDAIKIGDLKLSFKQHKVMRQNEVIKLTPTEWIILSTLVKRYPSVVKRADLEQLIWGDDDVEQGKFGVHLHGLRKAIDKPFDTAIIETVVNVGLRLIEH